MSENIDPMIGWYDRQLEREGEDRQFAIDTLRIIVGRDPCRIRSFRNFVIENGYGTISTMDVMLPEGGWDIRDTATNSNL